MRGSFVRLTNNPENNLPAQPGNPNYAHGKNQGSPKRLENTILGNEKGYMLIRTLSIINNGNNISYPQSFFGSVSDCKAFMDVVSLITITIEKIMILTTLYAWPDIVFHDIRL